MTTYSDCMHGKINESRRKYHKRCRRQMIKEA